MKKQFGCKSFLYAAEAFLTSLFFHVSSHGSLFKKLVLSVSNPYLIKSWYLGTKSTIWNHSHEKSLPLCADSSTQLNSFKWNNSWCTFQWACCKCGTCSPCLQACLSQEVCVTVWLSSSHGWCCPPRRRRSARRSPLAAPRGTSAPGCCCPRRSQYTGKASGLHGTPLVSVMGSAQREEVPEAQLQGKQNKNRKAKSRLIPLLWILESELIVYNSSLLDLRVKTLT